MGPNRELRNSTLRVWRIQLDFVANKANWNVKLVLNAETGYVGFSTKVSAYRVGPL